MRKTLTALSALLMGGCATTAPLPAELQVYYDAPLYCQGDDECQLYWERATYFVTATSGYKIQIHNTSLIETYNPIDYSPELAFSISREPMGGDTYRIHTSAWCNNFLGCNPDSRLTVARAKRYIAEGVM